MADVKVVESFMGTQITNENGRFRAGCYRTSFNGETQTHLLLYKKIDTPPTYLRIQSGCLIGDILGDQQCDCNSQLTAAMRYINDKNNGVIIYTVEHDGRGRGVLSKLKVYHMREKHGISSSDACEKLGIIYDKRDYTPITTVLLNIGITEAILLTSNRKKKKAVVAAGIQVVSTVDL